MSSEWTPSMANYRLNAPATLERISAMDNLKLDIHGMETWQISMTVMEDSASFLQAGVGGTFLIDWLTCNKQHEDQD